MTTRYICDHARQFDECDGCWENIPHKQDDDDCAESVCVHTRVKSKCIPVEPPTDPPHTLTGDTK